LACTVTGVGHHANTSIKLEKGFCRLFFFQSNIHVHQLTSGPAKVYFYQGAMPKVPEDVGDIAWGYWSLNDDFLAPAPTFEEFTDNFSSPYFR
jgi:hypothetical protein